MNEMMGGLYTKIVHLRLKIDMTMLNSPDRWSPKFDCLLSHSHFSQGFPADYET